MKFAPSFCPARLLLRGALLLAFCCALNVGAGAQSGRHSTRRERPTPEPMPIITPPPTPDPKKGRSLPNVPLIIAGRIGPKVMKARAEVIYNNFAMRLGGAMKVASVGLAKRDEAVKRAQGEAWPYVVFVEFEFEAFRDGAVVFSSPDIVVKYSVIDAQTGKSKGSGRVYYRPGGAAERGGDAPVKITPEAAGEEVAERVLDWFALSAGRPKLPGSSP
ncbi:MAG: hypothetical protein LC800_18740 [Acidobacteria bacterium]|nr:hypothetical protein [Acidobacteriota bacterium]